MKSEIQSKYLRSFSLSCRFIIICCAICTISCKKYLLVDTPTNIVGSTNVYKEDLTAAAAMTGIYSNFTGSQFIGGGIPGVGPRLGAAADELTLFYAGHQNFDPFFRNNLQAIAGPDVTLWTNTYPIIYQCNAVIEGVSASSTLTPSLKKQIIAEAKFMRALSFFYLTNLYGDIPLPVTSDYKVNSLLARSPKDIVYTQIKKDLGDAIADLNENYIASDEKTVTVERLRPNKFTANALLARVYLYNEEYANAEIESTKIIENKNIYDTVPLASAFLKNTKETIWALQHVLAGRNTEDGNYYVIPSSGPSSLVPFYLSDSLFKSFEVNDRRVNSWIGSVTTTGASPITYKFPYKYKVSLNNQPITEAQIVFRTAEQYLIRAEARVQLNKLSAARDDLNVIRKRAGLPNTITNTQSQLLNEVIDERRHELFAEYGHRWFDLKRTNRLDALMTVYSPLKRGVWNPTSKLLPIPVADLLTGINLTQNPGY